MPDHTASRAETCPKPATAADLDIDHLVAAHYGYIHRLAVSILDDLNEAEDAAQDTFIAASRSLSAFRAEADPKTWLTAIAVNACRALGEVGTPQCRPLLRVIAGDQARQDFLFSVRHAAGRALRRLEKRLLLSAS